MGFDCEAGSGVGTAWYVARALGGCGYANVFTRVASVAECCEPIVVRQQEWVREARLDDGGERGRERVRVYVCMDRELDAESTANAVARDLAACDWAKVPVVAGTRIVAVDVGAPTELGRDGSGRWVRSLDVECSVVRDGE